MPRPFDPIAIVGQSCVLPGALTPGQLWDAVMRGADLLSTPLPGCWRMSADLVIHDEGIDRAVSQRGGYVREFESVFDPASFGVPAEQLLALDPVVQWTLHAAREALRTAGLEREARTRRGGLVLGNLSYPSASLSRFAEQVWLDLQDRSFLAGRSHEVLRQSPVDPLNRFMSGWPAIHTARLLGLSEGGFALDAACASSLYAIKYACDRLHHRRVDLMLAGGVNAVDKLFLQMGFSALGAVSKSGHSRPFHSQADGVVPSEGAAFVVLKRLDDAVSAGNEILGVIRGIGLSNDGRGRGFLAPTQPGQIRAMRSAYLAAGIEPAAVSLIECHGTGTPVGDATEIGSMSEVFRGCEGIPIGSVKSNIGHLVTAAGVGGLLKLLGAMRTNVRPPMREADRPLDVISESPLRLLGQAEEWSVKGPKLAALSAFGFGGNNAHLILEQWKGRGAPSACHRSEPVPMLEHDEIAVVGIGACVADGQCRQDFARTLFSGESRVRTRDDGLVGAYAEHVVLAGDKMRFPPSDLRLALPQQLMALKSAMEAARDAGTLDVERTGVMIGMQCDAEIARCGMRWRLAEWASLFERSSGEALGRDWLTHARDAVEPPLLSAGVLGKMPNLVANRINSHFDWRGQSLTVSAEEASGLVALECAIDALRGDEVDAAVVGAVDLACEPVHAAAARAVLKPFKHIPGDAAVTLVLKRLCDARRDGNTVYGVVSCSGASSADVAWSTESASGSLVPQFGHCHAASGLLHLTAALLACHHHALPQGMDHPAVPWLPPPGSARSIALEVGCLGGESKTIHVHALPASDGAGVLLEPVPVVHCYAGANRHELLRSITDAKESGAGPCKLTVVAATALELQQRLDIARRQLETTDDVSRLRLGEGMYFRAEPVDGELAFVYGMAAASHAGMGARLLLALPELVTGLDGRFRDPASIVSMLGGARGGEERELLDQLRAYSLLCHVHTDLTTGILGLRPAAAIGLCTGESSALFCLGAWSAPEEMFDAIDRSGLYTRELAGRFEAVKRAWREGDVDGDHEKTVQWAHWRILLPVKQVTEALANEPLVHLAIVHTPGDCLIAGQADACERVAARLGPPNAKAVDGGIAVHCPEAEQFAAVWRAIHLRPTVEVPGVRFYSHHLGTHYPLSAEAVADAITGQALHTIEFPKVIEQAWCDGVRVFIEHGPRGLCSDWIREILGPRDHVVINLDSAHTSPVRQAANVVAQLMAAGVPVQHEAFNQRLRRAFCAMVSSRPMESGFTMPAHPPAIALLALRLAPDFGPPLPQPTPALVKPGPKLSRTQLEVLAAGRVSSIFGQRFAQQDGYLRQVRMPEPPLLLVDRVTGIDAEPGSMGLGTIWTETDVRSESWYLHRGHMAPGLMIEAGQADLLLISWLGIDFRNRGERVYRLLGCTLTFHGSLPRPGETLSYEIHVDGHARHGKVELFFFHYDCTVRGVNRLSVRGGQAGFFSDAELAGSKGVLWDPLTAACSEGATVAPPVVECAYRSFSVDQLRAFSQGRIHECFGRGFEMAQTHTDPPCIAGGRLCLLDAVTHFDPAGGPWKRGYLRAARRIRRDDWFFEGHFHNDPCMPGTLMFEGCLQMMAFYLTAMGFTLDKDGWRFEPVSDENCHLVCRGQVTPDSRELVYELFVDELVGGIAPVLRADLLCTVDGVKAFHCKRMAYRLVPSWPLENRPGLLEDGEDAKTCAVIDGFRFDYRSLLAAAWGKPSGAFGERFSVFDGHRKVARLPGPPYHFMSRVVKVDGDCAPRAGAAVTVEYDIPSDAWYFSENGNRTMPMCVLLEAALQPCGWLSSYVGCSLLVSQDLKFRNLDGIGTQHAELFPDARTLTTQARLTSVSRSGDTFIVSFEVACALDGKPVYSLKTVFGYFPYAAFDNQAGLPTPPANDAPCEACDCKIDLCERPARYFDRQLHLPRGMLLMIDRVIAYGPRAGAAGLGRLRAEKDVAHSLWFFRAHFFQDPVQPGSLGLEAMVQLLQFYMLHTNMDEGLENPRFEPMAVERTLTWKFRGQVVPANRLIGIEVEVQEMGRDERGPFVIAKGWLSVDGLPIYEASGLSARIASTGAAPSRELLHETLVDPAREPWLRDHCPTCTVPTLAMTDIADRIAQAAKSACPLQEVVGLEDVQVHKWLVIDGPRRLQTRATILDDHAVQVSLLAWRDAANPKLSRFEEAAVARVAMAPRYPAPPAPLRALEGAITEGAPYEDFLFHGPAFRVLRRLAIGPDGLSSELDAGGGGVPIGLLHPALLDGMFHGPYADLGRWNLPLDRVAYPVRIVRMNLHSGAPGNGLVRCEVRLAGVDEASQQLKVHAQFMVGESVWADVDAVLAMVPKGRLGMQPGRLRRAFLVDRRPVAGMSLSRFEGEETRLTQDEVKASDFLPGSLCAAYALPRGDLASLTRDIAIKEHVAQRVGAHPSSIRIEISSDGTASGMCHAMPLNRFRVAIENMQGEVVVRSEGRPVIDMTPVFAHWRCVLGQSVPVFEEIFRGFANQFLDRLVLADPQAFDALRGKPRIYLCNHQVQIESLLFTAIVGALGSTPVVTLANAKHEKRWVGQLLEFITSYPGTRDPHWVRYFDREKPHSLACILEDFKQEMTEQGRSVMVHVEGTRAHDCRSAVRHMSSLLIELALEADTPIVPVRFSGGLPVQPVKHKLDFPVGYAKQDYHLGAPIHPQSLQPLSLLERKRRVIEAINSLGPNSAEEMPLASDTAFQTRVQELQSERQIAQVQAVILSIIQDSPVLADPRGDAHRFANDPNGRWLGEVAAWLGTRCDQFA